jgi:RimJ/RimL family protein N-acetyltransferase
MTIVRTDPRGPAALLPQEIRTERLLLRRWRDTDLEPFAEMNADPLVMQYMPTVLDREGTDALVARFRDQFDRLGYGLWAVEVPGVAPLIGFVGLSVPRFSAHFTPCVEVGWRLAHAHWGHGYATEAARGALRFAFELVGLQEIVSFTVPSNTRSRVVMERLGMLRDPADDFDHPALPAGHPLRPHVLYRLSRERWQRGA